MYPNANAERGSLFLLSLPSLSLCVCESIFVSVYVSYMFLWVHMHVWMHTRVAGSRGQWRVSSLIAFHLTLWDRLSHWNLGSSICLGRLANRFQRSSLLYLFRVRMTGVSCHATFSCGRWIPELKNSCLYVYQISHLLSPCLFLNRKWEIQKWGLSVTFLGSNIILLLVSTICTNRNGITVSILDFSKVNAPLVHLLTH